MNWLLWRQHRGQSLVAGIAIALFALVVGITGLHMAHEYDNAVNSCSTADGCQVVGQLFRGYGAIIDTVHLTIALPLILGLFFGVVLIGREVEQSTNVLVWTQTVTRRRWLFLKVAFALGATFVVSLAVSALVTWWSGTPNSLNGNRFEGAQFDTQNLVPIAHALFAVALGIAAGALLRRTLPALALTVGLFAAVRIAVSVYLRPHYRAAVSQSFPIGTDRDVPSGSWTVTRALLDPASRPVNGAVRIADPCAGSIDRGGLDKCLGELGYRSVITYHPPSQYWQFQLIESALYLAVAAALVTFALVYTLRRDA